MSLADSQRSVSNGGIGMQLRNAVLKLIVSRGFPKCYGGRTNGNVQPVAQYPEGRLY